MIDESAGRYVREPVDGSVRPCRTDREDAESWRAACDMIRGLYGESEHNADPARCWDLFVGLVFMAANRA